MSNQLLVPSVNVRRSSVDVDRTSSGDETDPDSRLQLPVVSQLRRGSGNHLMIPGEEDAAPPLYLLLPQVSTGQQTRRGSSVLQHDEFGNPILVDNSNINFPTHTRVRRHRSLPSPFISGAVPASVSPPAPAAGTGRRPSGIALPHNSAQMMIGNNAGRRMSIMQPSAQAGTAADGTSTGREAGQQTTWNSDNNAGVTMVQGYSSPQQEQQQHRRSSSFRRPVSRICCWSAACLFLLYSPLFPSSTLSCLSALLHTLSRLIPETSSCLSVTNDCRNQTAVHYMRCPSSPLPPHQCMKSASGLIIYLFLAAVRHRHMSC